MTKNFAELSKEEQILMACKRTLTEVIKDTATKPGMRHPLAENTVAGLRDCLVMISQREAELAEEAGRPSQARPRFVDEGTQPGDEVVVSIDAIKRPGQD